MKTQPCDITKAIGRLTSAADAIDRQVTFMEVCGTHTMSAFRSGLGSLLPSNVRLLSGPGCPVCVTAQGDIDQLIELAQDHGAMVCTYGDMLRVPGRRGSLETVRGRGGAVRVVYSPMDAVQLAAERREQQVVFASVGFETTAPGAAAAVCEAEARRLENFSLFVSHKRIIPAMLGLLDADFVALDGFMCPGHVSVIIGARAYEPVVQRGKLPCVIAGFEEPQMALALALLTEQVRDGRAELVNAYPQAVTEAGNLVAQRLLARIFEPADVRWRGLGVIEDSGLVLRHAYRRFDAVERFGLGEASERELAGCRCGEVVTGAVTPAECPLFDHGCTPVHPIGPCMVSSEGTCAAWFKYRRSRAATTRTAEGQVITR